MIDDRPRSPRDVFALGCDGSAVARGAGALSILNDNQKPYVPPRFWQIGRVLRVRAFGEMDTDTLHLGSLFYLAIGSEEIAQFSVTEAADQSAVPWYLAVDLLCRVIGPTPEDPTARTKFLPVGRFMSAAGDPAVQLLPITTPADGAGFNNDFGGNLDLLASLLGTTGSIVCHYFRWEIVD